MTRVLRFASCLCVVRSKSATSAVKSSPGLPNYALKLAPGPPEHAPSAPLFACTSTAKALSKGMRCAAVPLRCTLRPAAPAQLNAVRYVAGSAFSDEHKE